MGSLCFHTCFLELVDEKVDSSSQPGITVIMMMGISDIHSSTEVVAAVVDERRDQQSVFSIQACSHSRQAEVGCHGHHEQGRPQRAEAIEGKVTTSSLGCACIFCTIGCPKGAAPESIGVDSQDGKSGVVLGQN